MRLLLFFFFFLHLVLVDFLGSEIYVASSPTGWHLDNWCFRGADSPSDEWRWDTTVREEAQRFTGGGRKKVIGKRRGCIRKRAVWRLKGKWHLLTLNMAAERSGKRKRPLERLNGIDRGLQQVNAESCPASVGLRGDMNSLLVILQDK